MTLFANSSKSTGLQIVQRRCRYDSPRGEMFIGLREQGFISAHVVRCPGCECSYRTFYRYPEAGPSARERQTRAVFFGTRIAKSHPDHTEELIEAGE